MTMLHLDRMGREQSRAIILRGDPRQSAARRVEEQIIDRADGIPLFIEELTKTILESGSIDDPR